MILRSLLRTSPSICRFTTYQTRMESPSPSTSATSNPLIAAVAEPKRKKNPKSAGQSSAGTGNKSSKLRGQKDDAPQFQLSKTLSWILRHGAQSEGLPMRNDGYAKIDDLLKNPKFKALDLEKIKAIVDADKKSRYTLTNEDGIWWIRANQGHSIQSVELELHPILKVEDIPTGIAVHGTTRKAWDSIAKEGLSRMKRNHIHLAQGLAGGEGVISGMRNSSSVLIYIDVAKALRAGHQFFLSSNGVVLAPGDERGYLSPEFFLKVTDKTGKEISLDVQNTPQTSGPAV